MADADGQAITEWDEHGNPIKPGVAAGTTAATEWDEKGNPIAPAAEMNRTPAPAATAPPKRSWLQRVNDWYTKETNIPNDPYAVGKGVLPAGGATPSSPRSALLNTATMSMVPMAPALAAAPIATGLAAGGGIGGGYAGRELGKAVGAPELGEDIGGLTGSVLGGGLGKALPSRAGLSRFVRDPLTGKPRSPYQLAVEKVLPDPDAAARAQAEATPVNERMRAESSEKFARNQADIEATRQKELANMERLKEQDAQARMRRGREQSILDRKTAAEAPRGIVAPRGLPPELGEGRPATWDNETVDKLARWGDPDAIAQQRLRMLGGEGRVPLNFPTTESNPRSVTRFSPEGAPLLDVAPPEAVRTGTGPPPVRIQENPVLAERRAGLPTAEESEPTEVKIRGLTAEEPKPARVKREEVPSVEKLYSREEIADAEGLIQQEVGMLQSADRPGRYFDESAEGEHVLTGNQRLGIDRMGGSWRGVTSLRDSMPFLKQHPEWSPGQLEKALRNKDSALYKRAISAAVDHIRAEETAEREAIQTESQAEAVGEPIFPGMGREVAAQERGAAQVKGEELGRRMNEPRSIESAAGEMETKSPLFRGTVASPQREIFGQAPPIEAPGTAALGERRTGEGNPPLGIRERRSVAQGLAPIDETIRLRAYYKGIMDDLSIPQAEREIAARAYHETDPALVGGGGEALEKEMLSARAAKPMSREEALANEAKRKVKNRR